MVERLKAKYALDLNYKTPGIIRTYGKHKEVEVAYSPGFVRQLNDALSNLKDNPEKLIDKVDG